MIETSPPPVQPLSPSWLTRAVDANSCAQLQAHGAHPLLAHLWASRGVTSTQALETDLAALPHPSLLKGMSAAAQDLAQAIRQQQRLVIVADYDCDGATACALGLRGLRLLGAQHLQHLVPDRMRDGYGLTPAIAERVHALGADWLITVDNGIASLDGVARARALGLKVLITDHHLPAATLPLAHHIVNPNQPGCAYPSKHLSGVGVMFQVLLATRAALRDAGVWDSSTQPRLDVLLPLVALGTVADLVRLDEHNRRWVHQGLKRLRTGRTFAGLQALFEVSGRNPASATAADLGFAIGPRINAAGRLSDMNLGIQCLLCDDPDQASQMAQALDQINRKRRDMQDDMAQAAQRLATSAFTAQPGAALCVFDESFHEGVVGIVASRLKEQWHRPSFVFAQSQLNPMELRGSGRSIAGFHLRDALDLVSKRHPGVLQRFGGHAMAAGCTLMRQDLAAFAQAWVQVAKEQLSAQDLLDRIWHDGPLAAPWLNLETAMMLRESVWGQGFAEPVFCNTLEVLNQRLVGERHLKLQVRLHGQTLNAIHFDRTQPLPATCEALLALEINHWQGRDDLQLRLLSTRSRVSP